MVDYQKLLGRTHCPVCNSDKLKVVAVVDQGGVPPGEPEHNIGYHHVMLAHCPSCGRGLIERLDHDCFDFESVFDQYEWYILDKTGLKELLEAIKACPNPMTHGCECQLHSSLRQSIELLPRTHWKTAFEDKQHEHRVSITWKHGLPQLRNEVV